MDYERAYFDLLKCHHALKAENERLRAQLGMPAPSPNAVTEIPPSSVQQLQGKHHKRAETPVNSTIADLLNQIAMLWPSGRLQTSHNGLKTPAISTVADLLNNDMMLRQKRTATTTIKRAENPSKFNRS